MLIECTVKGLGLLITSAALLKMCKLPLCRFWKTSTQMTSTADVPIKTGSCGELSFFLSLCVSLNPAPSCQFYTQKYTKMLRLCLNIEVLFLEYLPAHALLVDCRKSIILLTWPFPKHTGTFFTTGDIFLYIFFFFFSNQAGGTWMERLQLSIKSHARCERSTRI